MSVQSMINHPYGKLLNKIDYYKYLDNYEYKGTVNKYQNSGNFKMLKKAHDASHSHKYPVAYPYNSIWDDVPTSLQLRVNGYIQ